MQDTKGLSRLEEPPRPFVRRRRRRLLLKREIICVLHSSSSLLYVSILFFVCRLGRSVSSTFGPSKTGKRSLRVLYERYLYHPERVLTFDTFFCCCFVFKSSCCCFLIVNPQKKRDSRSCGVVSCALLRFGGERKRERETFIPFPFSFALLGRPFHRFWSGARAGRERERFRATFRP